MQVKQVFKEHEKYKTLFSISKDDDKNIKDVEVKDEGEECELLEERIRLNPELQYFSQLVVV